MLTYIYIHTQVAPIGDHSEMTHTPVLTLDHVHNTHIHLGAQSGVKITHTHAHTRTYTHVDRLHKHLVARSSYTITGAFPLHTCSVTRYLHPYFTPVERVFLVKTVILQTTVRHLGVERPFSSLLYRMLLTLYLYKQSAIQIRWLKISTTKYVITQ